MKKKHFHIITLFIVSYLVVIGLIFIAITVFNMSSSKNNNIPTIDYTVSFAPPTPSAIPVSKSPLAIHSAIPYWEQTKAVATFKEHVANYNSISMFWYYVNSDLEVAPYGDANEDESIITYAHEHNVKVLALVTNLPDAEGTTWSSDRIRPLIETKEARTKHIQDLIDLMEKKNFDGINIDYEELDTNLKDEFSLFIKELSIALHNRGKLVGVALHPKSGEGIPIEDNGSRAQDWKVLGQYADQLYIMAYGEHWDTSSAGPPASIPWDTKIINYAKQIKMPLNKIFFGIPLYGVRWEVDKKEGIGYLYTEIEELQKKVNAKPQWDKNSQTPFIRYDENGKLYELWYENAESVKAKTALVKTNGLGGVTFWHIGGEDPGIWNNIKEASH